ncbi:MAG TPA: hypothetical protein VHU40_02995, partial [Polyangia bacterium]|nr:hypothetical protein [Polyangia bacterium]
MKDRPFENGGTGSPSADDLPRWRETSMDPSALPARAADLADAARDVASPSPLVLARIYANVVDGGGRRSRLRGVPWGLRLATLMVLLFMSVATAKGAIVLWHRYVSPIIQPITPPVAAPKKLVSLATPKKRVESAPVVEAAAEPAPAAPVVAAPARPRRTSSPE